MVETTTQYDSKIYDDAVNVFSKIEFEIVDTDAYEDAGTLTVTSENGFSRKDQTTDLSRELSGKFLTWEEDYVILDGSVVLPPKATETGYQVGWWSDEISQADKTFSTPQVYTKNFNSAQSSIGITVTFQEDEYAEDFTIQVYDASDVLIDSDTVTGNTEYKYVWQASLSDYRKVVITFTKTANAKRMVRVVEVDWGIIKEYTDDNIVDFDILKEVDLISNELTSDEINFKIDNTAAEFNPLNPVGFYPFLEKRQKIIPYLGLDLGSSTEWIQMGIFYLTNWFNKPGGLTADFTARGILDIMKQHDFRKGMLESETATNRLTEVFTDFGLTSDEYNIDSALDSITLTGNLPVVDYCEAIRLIAQAGNAVVYEDREGVIQVKQLTLTASVDTIDFDNAYEIPGLNLTKRINTTNVEINEYTAKASSETVYDGTVVINGTEDVWIEYKEFPAKSLSSVVTGATSVNSETYYSNAALLNITASGSVTITTTGTVWERAKSIYPVTASDKTSDEKILAEQIDNPLIATTSIADSVGSYIMDELEKRVINDIKWTGNMAHELNDIIVVEDEFSENKESRIYQNEFVYDGALICYTKSKGV